MSDETPPGDMLDAIFRLCDAVERGEAEHPQSPSLQLARYVRMLDAWLVRGGYWPERWSGRGVNLDLGDAGPQVYIEIDKIRGLLDGQNLVLPSKNPQLVLAQPLVKDDGRVVACLATHAVFSSDPAAAVRQLFVMLRDTIQGVKS